jgi:hypothetical protein
MSIDSHENHQIATFNHLALRLIVIVIFEQELQLNFGTYAVSAGSVQDSFVVRHHSLTCMSQ